MPKATSQTFTRQHGLAAASRCPDKEKKGESSAVAGGARNHLFNTDRFGQHILTNPLVAQGIVDKAELKPTDVVLEVGPGTGNLTVRILPACRKVIASEMDPRMAAEVQKRVLGTPQQKKLELILGDFIKADLPYFDVCISNTPYQISSPLVFKLLSQRPVIRCAVLMFQREFALRLCAAPGSKMWCRLAANVQMYARVEHVMKVGKGNFRPPPQVESSVVRIKPLDPPPAVRFEEFDGLNRVVFSRMHKTTRACFKARGVKEMVEKNYRTWCAMSEKIVEDDFDPWALIDDVLSTTLVPAKTLDEDEIRPAYGDMRAAQLSGNDLLELLAAFNTRGVHFA
ncbi:hypothetical protein CcaverHIS631_0607790 [Cutaneotrichosporon cavernicola]|nr:hypothetical protein CcaverHIS631_0607790 [Cutaneotrichosporon cavernicola]BEJ09860.1 hypothetical protein CcaverHIS641_0607750 [Cutaneotrichosporon cavernicola]